MELKNIKPKTPSQRHLIQIKERLFKKPFIKKNTVGLKNSNGRNNSGKITVRHKGRGHKQNYRIINFNRNYDSTGIVCSIEYDPNRNSNISSVFDFETNSFFYIIAPKNIKVGDIIKSGTNVEPKLGFSLPLINIPIGCLIHNISTKVNKCAQFTRSAGTFSFIKEKELEYVKIKISSGEHRLVLAKCYASIGVVSNELFFLKQLGKAGRSRWLNRRPTVRGVAMNPIDHPHGGGEGKKSGKGKTPWGKPVKKGSTSKSKNKLIIKT